MELDHCHLGRGTGVFPTEAIPGRCRKSMSFGLLYVFGGECRRSLGIIYKDLLEESFCSTSHQEQLPLSQGLFFHLLNPTNSLTMKSQTLFQIVSLLPALLLVVNAAPARRDGNHPLRGSESLVGYSSTEDLASGTKPDLQYSLLPGQTEDPKIGTYLDFQKVENPQPIRGSAGGDDPGPRKLGLQLRDI